MILSQTISVVIPVKGRLEFTKEAISSVYTQKGVDMRKVDIIIVDDNRESETIWREVKKIFPEVNVMKNEDKEGPGGKRNSALNHLKSKYIAFLDSDDAWLPTFLMTSLQVLEKEKQVSATLSLSSLYFSQDFPIIEKCKVLLLNLIKDTILGFSVLFRSSELPKTGFFLPQISHVLFRSSAIRKIRFDYEYRRGGEDWAFIAKVLEKGCIRIIPQRLVKFRYSVSSSTMEKVNLGLKWNSYRKVIKRLASDFKRGILYRLLLLYIRVGSSGV